MNLLKFSYKNSIRFLSGENNELPPDYVIWVLARALAWAFLDQRPSTEKHSAVNARHVGHIILGYRLDQCIARLGMAGNTDTLESLLALYRECGGFKRAAETPSAKQLLRLLKKKRQDIRYVFHIVRYMCRSSVYLEADKCTLEYAKRFVQKDGSCEDEGDVRELSLSKISKVWEQYAPSAPLIYAACLMMRCDLVEIKNPDRIFDHLEVLAKRHERIKRLLGYASHAAACLSKRARKVRSRPYKDIPQKMPSYKSFSGEEAVVISSIDLTASIQ